MRAKLRALWFILTAKRTDWPHRIAPPRIVMGLTVGGLAVAGGLVLQLQPTAWTSGPTFVQMVTWGEDVGFHSHPMTLWAIAFGALGLGTLLSLAKLRAVLAGVFTILQASALGLYTSGSWRAVGPHQHPLVHGFPVPATYSTAFAPLMFSGLTLWWVLTGGALISVRPGKPWPFR